MSDEIPRGQIFRCPVCGAEVAVLAPECGQFDPHCCNRPMARTNRRSAFYVCPVCGAEVAVVRAGEGIFEPRCCNTDMIRIAT